MIGRRSLLGALLLLAASAAAQATPVQATPAQRIVSLAPFITELVFAAGAGDRLVAVDAHSDHPAAARALPDIGDAFGFDLEGIIQLRPDLVLAWGTGTPDALMERLEQFGIRVVILEPESLDDIAGALREIGHLAGTSETAEAAARSFENSLAMLRNRHAGGQPVEVFYQVAPEPLITLNGRHLVSQAIALCGGRNIFADLGEIAPRVSPEAVIQADPAVIVTGSGDCAAERPLEFWRKWPEMRAVREGRLHCLDADLLVRQTPRMLAGIRELCALLAPERESPPPPTRSG